MVARCHADVQKETLSPISNSPKSHGSRNERKTIKVLPMLKAKLDMVSLRRVKRP
jgi:hypothetical protein